MSVNFGQNGFVKLAPQISKMQRLAGKVGFLAKAVEDADYEGVKEFASDMKKLGVPLEHAPQVSVFNLDFNILTVGNVNVGKKQSTQGPPQLY
jgi:hypothetical protein